MNYVGADGNACFIGAGYNNRITGFSVESNIGAGKGHLISNANESFIGAGKYNYQYVNTKNYTLDYSWNVEGNVSVSQNPTYYDPYVIETNCGLDNPVCALDHWADLAFRFYIDVPTPKLVDDVALERKVQPYKNQELWVVILGQII